MSYAYDMVYQLPTDLLHLLGNQLRCWDHCLESTGPTNPINLNTMSVLDQSLLDSSGPKKLIPTIGTSGDTSWRQIQHIDLVRMTLRYHLVQRMLQRD